MRYVAEYPEEFDFDVVLRDGEVVRMRPIRPDDEDLEADFFRRVSPESAYFRFFRYRGELTAEELEHFTHVDYSDRMAFVALHEGHIIGVGRYDLLAPSETEGERVAEVAFLVEDEFQGRGVGTLLLQQLAVYARIQGIVAFRAFVLSDNRSMLKVFRSSGYAVRRRDLSAGVYELELPTAYTEDARVADAEHEKWAIATSLRPLFEPTSIAVVGASRDASSIGARLFRNLLATGFKGPVYPVNPHASVVHSVKAYASVTDIPDAVDLAFVVVPARDVIQVATECARKQVRAIVVISAGFAETGEEGADLERRLVEVVRGAGMRMVGPNCMGFINTDQEVRLNGQFGPVFPPAGNVAMSSQSGALGLAILDFAAQTGIGISSFVSIGNKADVSGNDLLLYWEDDPHTDVVLLYVESFGNPRRFARLARRIGRRKPIVAVKSGRSEAGARAALGHTGSLANVEVAVEALFRQTGVVRTDTLTELFDVATLFANQPVPKGRRVGVVTNAGGPAILCADALEARGLQLPELSAATQEALRAKLPREAAVGNPVDMIAAAGPSEYRYCLEQVLMSGEVDAVIAIYIPATRGAVDEVADAIQAAAAGADGQTVLSVLMQRPRVSESASDHTPRVPTYQFPEQAARALAATAGYGAWRSRPEGREVSFADVDHDAAARIIEPASDRLGGEGGWLEPELVLEVLEAFRLPVVRTLRASTAEEAVARADELSCPVVLKVISPTAVHKTDIGGVVINVQGADEVRSAFERVIASASDATGVLIQEFTSGHEVIIGMAEDSVFGPLIAFGLGGIFVELIKDVTFRIHPLTDIDVEEMIDEVRASPILHGFRGPPGDIAAVREALHRVSSLVTHFPELVELDLNPVMVLPPGQGVRIVDARMRLRRVENVWLPSRKDIPGAIRSWPRS